MGAEALQPIRGMSDIDAPDIHLWQHLEEAAREVLACYHFTEVRTPLVEYTSVFTRSLGDTTDVVQKEMYTFEDRGGRSLTLRPEGTAGIMRYVANAGQDAQDARIYYLGPMFRAERPAAGRRRQFHQLGVEAIGTPSAAADAEMIALQVHLLTRWGIRDFKLELNTRGLPADHVRVAEGLRNDLAAVRSELCEDCQRRFDENPLRIVDCKKPGCRSQVAKLPPVTGYMSAEARDYLQEVLTYLDALEIPATPNPYLVRGLDYYQHTVWEVTHTGLGAQDALAGGGRYHMQMGRQTCEGVGFAVGLERILAVLQGQGRTGDEFAQRPCVWLVSQGDGAFRENLILMQSLRMRGIEAAMDLGGRSMKAQMRAANRAQSRYVIIRGDEEMECGTFQLKNMADGTQQELELPELMERLIQSSKLM